MKRIVSVFLSLSLVLSFMLPVAQATNTYGMVDSYTIEDSNGNALTFKLVDNGGGNFTLNYYLNNVLDTVYEMSRDSSIITATNQKTITRQSTTYTLDNSEMRQSMKSMLPDSRKPTGWSYMGNIFYGYSSSLTCSPTAILEYQDTASYADTFIVDTYANSGYADTVALVTSTLIAVILSLVCPVATIAATVVMCMISYYGGEVINGTISVLFRETYDCVTTEYDVRATMTGSNVDTSTKIYSGGVEQWVRYPNVPDEHYHDGLTWHPDQWQKRNVAEMIWNDAFYFWHTFPGVVRYGRI